MRERGRKIQRQKNKETETNGLRGREMDKGTERERKVEIKKETFRESENEETIGSVK